MSKNKNFNELNSSTIIKYSIAGTLLSLLLGIVFYYLFSSTIDRSIAYSSYLFLGLYPYSFYLSTIITVLILSSQIRNTYNSIIVGFAIGLFTGLLQQTAVLTVFGGQELMFFLEFIGSQTIELIILGIICAYIGNRCLKDKISIPIIDKYLGE